MSTFLSIWLRASYIPRWPLQYNLIGTNDAVHPFECAVVAHLIGTIEKEVFSGDVNPERMATKAIFHEGGEVGGLGDINTLAKNHDKETRDAIKRIEHIFECKLVDSLPAELQEHYRGYIMQEKESDEGLLVKAADDICAYIEASKELELGNYEFADAVPNCLNKVSIWCNKFKSVEYFCTTFLPQINQTIDKDFT